MVPNQWQQGQNAVQGQMNAYGQQARNNPYLQKVQATTHVSRFNPNRFGPVRGTKPTGGKVNLGAGKNPALPGTPGAPGTPEGDRRVGLDDFMRKQFPGPNGQPSVNPLLTGLRNASQRPLTI